MKKTIAVAIFSLFAASSFAQPAEDGNVWHGMCNSQDKNAQTICGMYVMGFLYGAASQAAHTKSPMVFCFPEGAAYLQAHDVFAKYLREHPEKRHLHGATLLLVSLKEAFPCSKTDTGKYSH